MTRDPRQEMFAQLIESGQIQFSDNGERFVYHTCCDRMFWRYVDGTWIYSPEYEHLDTEEFLAGYRL